MQCLEYMQLAEIIKSKWEKAPDALTKKVGLPLLRRNKLLFSMKSAIVLPCWSSKLEPHYGWYALKSPGKINRIGKGWTNCLI